MIGNGLHSSKATKYGTITHQANGEVSSSLTYPVYTEEWGLQCPKFSHTHNLHTSAVVPRAIKMVMVTTMNRQKF